MNGKVSMGYRVRKLSYKKRTWKFQYVSYKGEKQRSWDIQEKDYSGLGISVQSSYETAIQRCKELNAQEKLKTTAEKRRGIKLRLDHEHLLVSAFLSKPLTDEFEGLYIKDRYKAASHWLRVKKTLLDLNLDFQDYAFNKEQFYAYFIKQGYSYSYIQKIILLINKWGIFLARKRKIYYDPLPFPKHRDKEKILDNHEDKYGKLEALPLTPKMLSSVKGVLTEKHYNWLFLSVWFGLRPSEVDRLKEPPGPLTWQIIDKALWVYQSKLSGISRDKRLKPIPIKYLEQEIALQYIRACNIKRPLTKTLKKHLGEGIGCYSGRKGFTDLMLERGNRLEAISQWLGHQSIERTWKTYKDKNKVLLE